MNLPETTKARTGLSEDQSFRKSCFYVMVYSLKWIYFVEATSKLNLNYEKSNVLCIIDAVCLRIRTVPGPDS